MKKIFTWFLLFQKRLLKKPLFLITLVLIPFLLFVLNLSQQTSDGLVQVALYTEKNSWNQSFIQELITSSDDIIHFYEVSSEDALRKEIYVGRAECGYILSSTFHTDLRNYASRPKRNLITVVKKESSTATEVVNEIILGRIFSAISYPLAETYLETKQPEHFSSDSPYYEMAYSTFEEFRTPQLMFRYEYANGDSNSILNNTSHKSQNYYMMPIRGILSILIFLSGFIGTLFLLQDEKRGIFQFLRCKHKPLLQYGYLSSSMLLVTSFCYIAIFYTGLNVHFSYELLLYISYLLLLSGFFNLFRIVIRNTSLLCSLLPLFILSSLVICPVFVDLEQLPLLKILRLFLPVNYYLQAVHSGYRFFLLILLAVILSCGSIFLDWFLHNAKADI